MCEKYMVRMFQEMNGGSATHSGTIVGLVPRELSIYAESAQQAERLLQDDVARGVLPAGRVYQICPWLGNPEIIRSVAASVEGSFERVYLDPAAGLYSDLRRVRAPRAVSGD